MKKIFTFAAALLASLSMMAADYTPAATAVYTVGDAETLGTKWASKGQTQNFIVKGDTVIFNAFLCYQSNGDSPKQAWTGNTSGGSTNGTQEGMGSFPASSAWGTGDASTKTATTRSTRTYYYNVTNCSEVQVLINNMADNRESYVKAYEIVEGAVSSTAAATATRTENGLGIIVLDGLNVAKTYQIQVNTNMDSNSNFYAIAFISTGGTPVNRYTVTYMDGETVLGTETVKEGEKATKASTYEAKAHATFVGWFEDAALTVPADITAAITADKTFYGKWTADAFTASTSLNIEQLVLDNGKGYDIAGALTAAHIEYANINALDSLNDDPSKPNRNEPFLGLKLKKKDAYLEVAVNNGDVLRVKFGAVAAAFKVSVDGVDSTMETSTANTVYELTADKAEYVRFTIVTDSKTVVFKQIMINQEIANVILPDPIATSINNLEAAKAIKVIENGQIVIIKNGVRYNAVGAKL